MGDIRVDHTIVSGDMQNDPSVAKSGLQLAVQNSPLDKVDFSV